MKDLDFVLSRKLYLSVLQCSILVLVKAWIRIYKQGCDDSSVILQTKSLIVIKPAVTGFGIYFSLIFERELVVSTHYIWLRLPLTVFTLFWVNILSYKTALRKYACWLVKNCELEKTVDVIMAQARIIAIFEIKLDQLFSFLLFAVFSKRIREKCSPCF